MQIVYRLEAQQDVVEACAWYEEQHPGLAGAFAEELQHVEDLLRRYPAAFSPVHGDYRRAIMRRFPYSVYHRPLDDTTLEITAVLHHRQDAGQSAARE